MRTDKRTFLFLLALTCCGILFYRVLEDPGNALGLVSHMVGLFFPFLLGFCIAFVLNVPMRFFEDRFFPNAKRSRRSWGTASSSPRPSTTGWAAPFCWSC